MRLALLCVMFSTAGCNLLADQQSNFALVLTEEAKVQPSLVYGCVDRWIQSQDIMVLTSEVGRIQGWNGDKNPIFSVQVNEKNPTIRPKIDDQNAKKLEKMISSCSENPGGSPLSESFWTPFYQI
ncbi:hypothetical protein N9N48_05870 [Luminiphilus sp.]|nr:hypothetical protein [Luminiphilus sp.]